MGTTTKARRGDLVGVEITSASYASGLGRVTRTEFELFEVTGITRDGAVRAVRAVAWGSDYATPISRVFGAGRRWVIPAATIDKSAAISAAQSHTYPNSTTPKRWESFEEMREALRPYLTVPVRG